MVLIASSIFTKGGKALVTRQYVADMTRARLEGLLDAFPKLVGTEKSQRQHTFVETDSVRYVYQPLDNLYVVLVTTKASNILEDLETLRLFSRVIPEYCRSNEESEILDKSFDLIFAFDEIVVLGYRENVNLAQIRTFTEMDSHEERVHNQIQIAQQRAAHNVMTEKAKEIKRAEKLKRTLGKTAAGLASATGISSSSASQMATAVKDFATSSAGGGSGISSSDIFGSKIVPSRAAKPSGGGKALKLGQKNTTEDAFLQQLRSEDRNVVGGESKEVAAEHKNVEQIKTEPVQFKSVEKMNASLTRAGALTSCEIIGSVSLNVLKTEFNTVSIRMHNQLKQIPGQNKEHRSIQIQVHPNLDKSTWQSESVLRLKSEQKPYPLGVDVGILKWNIQLTDEESLPLTLNCWPNETPEGCVINIEYTLQREDLQLNDVQIKIPLPPSTTPIVSECEGDYEYLKHKSVIVWKLPIIDTNNKSGVLEFSTSNGNADHFFPVNVHFFSNQLSSKIMVTSVETPGSGEPVEFSIEERFVAEKYEIV